MIDLTPNQSSELPKKKCGTCGQVYPATEQYFCKRAKSKDKLGWDCKLCSSKKAQRWAKANPNKRQQQNRKYKNNNREKIRASDNVYRSTHREEINEKSRASRPQRRDKARITARKWEHTHLDRVRELKRHAQNRRRSRNKHLLHQFSANDWDFAVKYWGGCCAICGKPQGLWHKLAIDHWIPVNNPNCPGTIPENILPLCHGLNGCNNKKRHFDPVQWITKTLGPEQAKLKLKEIEQYFATVKRSIA